MGPRDNGTETAAHAPPEAAEGGSEALRLTLPVLGKGQIVITFPKRFESADWEFLKPIFMAYIDRMLEDDAHHTGEEDEP